jgi:hypothetical protein
VRRIVNFDRRRRQRQLCIVHETSIQDCRCLRTLIPVHRLTFASRPPFRALSLPHLHHPHNHNKAQCCRPRSPSLHFHLSPTHPSSKRPFNTPLDLPDLHHNPLALPPSSLRPSLDHTITFFTVPINASLLSWDQCRDARAFSVPTYRHQR